MGVIYFGIDQSWRAIQIARERYPDGIFLHSDFRRGYGFTDFWDCVFTNAVLQHFSNNSKKKILGLIHEILEPRGLFVMAECYHRDKPDDYTDGWTFTVKGWQNFIEQCGFESIDTRLPYFRFCKA